LKGNEEKLQAIATAQGENVSSLVSLVKENGELVSEMDVRFLGSLYCAVF
jgi:hypothetical protein